jgi:hypothetical protein
MLLKIFRVVWFFSLMAATGVLLYVYASLPEVVLVGEAGEGFTIPRESYFYAMLSLMTVFNFLVFVLRRLFSAEEPWNIVAWFYGLVILLNMFFIITLSFASLINSGERFDYPRIGVIIYGIVALMCAWALAWPAYLAMRKVAS